VDTPAFGKKRGENHQTFQMFKDPSIKLKRKQQKNKQGDAKKKGGFT
jgi:hypothetical protein